MNSKFTRVIITLFFALFFISAKAAPTGDIVDVTERALCGGRLGSSCLSVVVDGSESDSEASSSSSPDDTVEPFETPSSETTGPSEISSASAAAETPSAETPVVSISPFQKTPTHKPGPVDQDTPEVASPIIAAAKSNGAHTKHQLASTLLPVLLVSLGFILFA